MYSRLLDLVVAVMDGVCTEGRVMWVGEKGRLRGDGGSAEDGVVRFVWLIL